MNMQTKSSAAHQNVHGRAARQSSRQAGSVPLTTTRRARMLGWVNGSEGESREQFLDSDAAGLHEAGERR
ncbi:hypothetical protein [Rhizobacter sp. Root404]|jgi:hypothetical protein|uniref:hypothetical protein n=1 Tax=Rhizobacter sp. Root404 TaxID=1736528 RepID=UPI0006FF9B80|nr:hypothetical protein [Rhizobacter sp. Root404]KQW40397.1 hypothetical protein ASC76_02890 [Rhizobacter sp. Root404]